jgi:hypothetical protein
LKYEARILRPANPEIENIQLDWLKFRRRSQVEISKLPLICQR